MSAEVTAADLFSPWDMEVAYLNFGAMCGHGALAAAVGMDVCRVMAHFSQPDWVNVPIMGSAIKSLKRFATRVPGWPPSAHRGPAVTMIQFTGRWMNPGVPIVARCQHRHWVAVRVPYVWDSNAEKWLPRAEWEKTVLPSLLPPKGDGGWEPFRSFIWIEPEPTWIKPEPS